MIAGGSFLQLPPVPSLFDPGFYAFQSEKFMQTFHMELNSMLQCGKMNKIN